MLNDFMHAVRLIDADQDYLRFMFSDTFRKRNKFIAFTLNPSLRFSFWVRVARSSSFSGRLARHMLIRGYGSDVTPGYQINHALHAPHPIGIVIGSGVNFMGPVTIYQNVTIGADKFGGYPTLESGCKLFPNSVIFGGISIGANATVGAGSIVRQDVAPK